ncbi:MAG: hypothetical protein M3N26_02025, partial [Pseudomonadota bacterium]|nr:hypothetical protein [Pseudomonadota bacterium]
MPEAVVARVAAMLATEGAALQSLQMGMALPGMSPCPTAVLDTARVIAGLDVVITVDTMVAHLAGAIGVPVWLLLDAAPDWRWLAGEGGGAQGSPWYRGIRRYRQTEAGDWSEPVRAMLSDLTSLTQAGTVVL